MARMLCPHCGWTYDPSINGEGYDLVPNHWYKAEDCPGQGQHPRNAESDKRPLWREEQETKMYEAAIGLARKYETDAKTFAICLRDVCSYAATARDTNQPEWMEGLVEHLNNAAIALNEPTQFVLHKMTWNNETWIVAETIP